MPLGAVQTQKFIAFNALAQLSGSDRPRGKVGQIPSLICGKWVPTFRSPGLHEE